MEADDKHPESLSRSLSPLKSKFPLFQFSAPPVPVSIEPHRHASHPQARPFGLASTGMRWNPRWNMCGSSGNGPGQSAKQGLPPHVYPIATSRWPRPHGKFHWHFTESVPQRLVAGDLSKSRWREMLPPGLLEAREKRARASTHGWRYGHDLRTYGGWTTSLSGFHSACSSDPRAPAHSRISHRRVQPRQEDCSNGYSTPGSEHLGRHASSPISVAPYHSSGFPPFEIVKINGKS